MGRFFPEILVNFTTLGGGKKPENGNLHDIGRSLLVGCCVYICITLQANLASLKVFSVLNCITVEGTYCIGCCRPRRRFFCIYGFRTMLKSVGKWAVPWIYMYIFVKKMSLRRTGCRILLFSALIRTARILWYCYPHLLHTVSARAALIVSSNEHSYSLLIQFRVLCYQPSRHILFSLCDNL